MDPTLTIHALLVAAFLTFLWLTFRPRLAGMTRLRQRALILATPYVVLLFMLVSPTVFSAFIETVTRLDAALLAFCIILGAGASSVICVELVRTVVAKTRGWDDRLHFSVVGVSWLLFAVVQSIFVYLGRESLQPLHRS